ncbi:MAG: acetyl-CoA carboxylase biotin carboxyl carrier protein [Gemmatimonadetes bacterium]|nr:acetyl-CoA carboxylase biotin carboxyl carrier protein [Gemmatimonadota bacterium]MCY3679479.1 acetyl-CoA carboxylase biotin carboxyl carrier protein [Gemmatimonadota bacterium]MYA41983.1 acetyl-CoA carboxylase biotin carboxyl carrier protein [Gemmatimonadota bacterium]MYE94900.1 acetyl-CoA carboxylase biotin carboxyl carrier protein [Gemmatimonadota bacterium]MYJ11758.1 acetyl-CoA carboxylase biotin carboxyl carrier protein [Gemmatimonadota bacterium]
MDIEFVQALIRMLDESSLDNLELRRGGTRIRLSKSPGGAAVVAEAPPARSSADNPAPALATASPAPSDGSPPATLPPVADGSATGLAEITSPMVGTFYRAPSPEADPYVEVGGTVAAGDVLCVIEAMKLMNELECEVAGRIVEICVENAEPVDFGQVLFRVDPA